jgi:predicted DNA-binding transcriptional regulator AlpA
LQALVQEEVERREKTDPPEEPRPLNLYFLVKMNDVQLGDAVDAAVVADDGACDLEIGRLFRHLLFSVAAAAKYRLHGRTPCDDGDRDTTWTAELAQCLRVSPASVRRWYAAGVLPKPVKIGGRLRFDAQDVKQAIERMKTRS